MVEFKSAVQAKPFGVQIWLESAFFHFTAPRFKLVQILVPLVPDISTLKGTSLLVLQQV